MSELLDIEISKRSLGEMAPRFKLLSTLMPGYVAELESWQGKAREFADRVIRPKALEIDARCHDDPTYFDWDLVKASTPYGFLSMMVPKPLGGGGQLATATGIVLEEMCAACAGIANIFGANGLGVSGVLLGFDLYHYERTLTDLVRGDRNGEPVIFAAAVTEPLAGSDVEDREYMEKAKLVMEARPVPGGYLLNGRKVFISNGSVARWNTVMAPLDRKKPVETLCGFMVRQGTPGFSIGRVEKKMGQKACPAAELVFEDCFVPKRNLVGHEGEGMRFTELVLGASRGPVGAIATGIARGAFERIFDYARRKKVGGRRLIDRQWVQIRLADMARRIHLARQSYLDATMAFDFTGMPKLMKTLPARFALELLPSFVRGSELYHRLMGSKMGHQLVQGMFDRNLEESDLRHIQQYSSMAKVTGSDIAVEVAYEALQIAGLESSLARLELEKLYRDAKLTQIYEGTNQLNRHNIFTNAFPNEYADGCR
ncbi:MAG: acyl-CoA dehydrogenase family protein [Bradymonadales bacterium]|nr:acyl-CoA dehydrogenase family protein [Bradymonadales bacterium]